MEEQEKMLGQPDAKLELPAGKRHIPTFVGIAIIVLVALVLFGGVFAYQYFATKNNSIAGPALSEVEGWKTYTNTQYGFEFKYPDNMITGEGGGGGAFTLSLAVYNLDAEGKFKDLAASIDLYSKETVEKLGWQDRESGVDQKVLKNENGDMVLITIGFNKSEEIRNAFNGVVNTFKFTK
ncbi:MAG: hypothetical protein NTW11_03870 [Candidatus Staskawiczbacteria bacterium]|nr:hypothetical protein [Candidatus Staskawiczbacteria bacterium]